MSALRPKDDAELDLLATRIQGERLVLLPVSREVDADILREFTAAVTRYMIPKPVERMEEVHAFIDGARKGMAAGDEIILRIHHRATGEFLGICGLHNRSRGDSPELGIWLKAGAQGSRFGREAIHALAAWAKANLAFSYLIYPVDKRNVPSRRIAESLGGVVLRKTRHLSMSGYMLNELVYRIDSAGIPAPRDARR